MIGTDIITSADAKYQEKARKRFQKKCLTDRITSDKMLFTAEKAENKINLKGS